MKFLFVVLIAWSSVTVVHSQSVIKRTVEMKVMQKYKSMALENKTIGDHKQHYNEVDGNPYFYDTAMNADFVFLNGDILEEVPLRIDLYAGEFVGTDSKGTEMFIDLEYYKEIRMENGDVFKRGHPDFPDQFFNVLFSNDHLTLIKSRSVKHMEMSIINSGRRESINKFDKSTTYQLIRDAEITRIPFKKKKFFKALTKEDAGMLKAYAEDQKIKLNKEEDFVALIAHLGEYLASR